MISSDKRIQWKYKQIVNIPKEFKNFLWDEKNKIALEKLILRVYEYGDIEDLKKLYKKYPVQCFEFISRYQNIKRGVKYWIRTWFEGNN